MIDFFIIQINRFGIFRNYYNNYWTNLIPHFYLPLTQNDNLITTLLFKCNSHNYFGRVDYKIKKQILTC